MTKKLTEQWKDGKLPVGSYYVKFPNEEPQIYSSEYLKSFTVVKDAGRIDILAPVPSYEGNKKLQKKLEIATKALNDILNDGDDYWDKDKANEALTKIEGVK